jgi:V8-like Glu-specific endopeptidase
LVAADAPISRDLRAKVLPNGRTHAGRSELSRWGGDPRVTQYWTSERMKSAIRLDTPSSTAAVRRELEKFAKNNAPQTALTTTSKPAAAQERSGHRRAAPQAAPPVTNFSSTNGKVFFHNQIDNKNYICSGSAVNSQSKRLVITAGHCVHGGPRGTWHSNWQFVPNYYRGSRPRGTFQAYQLRTYSDWINYGETGRGFNSDVAFVTTLTNASGQRVVDAVGGHGTQYGGSRVFDVAIFGYPGNRDNGEVMWACWGTTGTRWIGLYRFVSLSGCNFGGGSSGGPWLAGYSNASGLGYVRSVTSNGPADNAYINGPYFDSRFPGLFAAANNDW